MKTMTLEEYEQRLKKINPNLRIRRRGYGDIVAIYDGDKYLIRLNYGEFNLNGYRKKYFNDRMETTYGNIEKRGRKTVTRMLKKHGYVTNLKDYASLLWGV